MAGLAHIAEQLRDGAWIVSYRTFLGPRFKVVGDFVGPASWTASVLHIAHSRAKSRDVRMTHTGKAPSLSASKLAP